jgi:hypothetical protein
VIGQTVAIIRAGHLDPDQTETERQPASPAMRLCQVFIAMW